MSKIKVGVLRGGPSGEYDVSLKTGANVISHLSHPKFEDKYHVHDIYISKDGTWHMYGVPVNPAEAAKKIDVFFNALHGTYGEDGTIQKILDAENTKYTGSGALGSALGMNKVLAKKVFKQYDIKTPHHIVIEKGSDFDPLQIFRTFPMPAVVKPSSSGSSLGVSIVKNFEALAPAIANAFEHDDVIIIEEFIMGVEAAVAVIDGFRGEDLYALPAIEIRHSREFFDYQAKYSDAKDGGSQEIVPGNFTSQEKIELERLAREVHRALGLRHYSRVDFIVSPRRGIYALEANTLPGLTDASLLPKAVQAVGASMPDFLDHLVTLAYEGK